MFQKKPKKHYKTGEKTAKKNLDQFLTYNLDQFLTYKTPNLGPANATKSQTLAFMNRSVLVPLSSRGYFYAIFRAYFQRVFGDNPRTNFFKAESKPQKILRVIVCNFYAEAPLLRSFADLRLRSLAFICPLLCACACFCERCV